MYSPCPPALTAIFHAAAGLEPEACRSHAAGLHTVLSGQEVQQFPPPGAGGTLAHRQAVPHRLGFNRGIALEHRREKGLPEAQSLGNLLQSVLGDDPAVQRLGLPQQLNQLVLVAGRSPALIEIQKLSKFLLMHEEPPCRKKETRPESCLFLYGGRYRIRTYDLPHVKRQGQPKQYKTHKYFNCLLCPVNYTQPVPSWQGPGAYNVR